MADIITLTAQPIRVTAIGRQPLYLALDVSSYDSLDIELVCAVEGTAANASVNLYTGMQIATEDGWIVTASNFAPLSGTGQVISRVTVTSGLFEFLRWDVSSLGGATSLTFFIRGIARERAGGGSVVGVAAAYLGGASPADQTLLIQSTSGGPLVLKAHGAATGPLLQVQDSTGNLVANFSDNSAITLLTEAAAGANANAYVFDSLNDMTASSDVFHVRFRNAGHNYFSPSGAAGLSYALYSDPANGNLLGEDVWSSTSAFHAVVSLGADGANTHHTFDTTNTISTTGAKLLTVANNGTEVLAILQDGTINLYGAIVGASASGQAKMRSSSGSGVLQTDDTTGSVVAYASNSLTINSVSFGYSGAGTSSQIKRTQVGERYQLVTKSANYTITLSDYYIGVDTTGAAVILTLPAPATATGGATFVVYDWKNTFNTNNLTIARNGTEKIDNAAANKVVSTQGARVFIWTDGTDWFTK